MLRCQCPYVTFVHCGHRRDGSWIPLHAWIDECLCYLLSMPHPDRWMGSCRDFWWKRGVWKIGNCSDITYFTYFLSMDRKHVMALFI